MSRRGRSSLSFRILGIEMRCMQCLRSTEKTVFAYVPLEYALGICCFLLLLSMILRMRFWGYWEVRKSNILVRFVGFWCFSVWYWESGLWNLLPSDAFWSLKYLKWPSEAKAIANPLNIHRFKLKFKQIAETCVTFVKKLIKSLIRSTIWDSSPKKYAKS